MTGWISTMPTLPDRDMEPPECNMVERDDMDFGSPDDDTEDLETDRLWAKEHA